MSTIEYDGRLYSPTWSHNSIKTDYFLQYFDALKRDNVEYVKEIYEKSGVDERKDLINLEFQYAIKNPWHHLSEISTKAIQSSNKLEFYTPATISAVSLSKKCLAFLLDKGARLNEAGRQGCILHALVWASYINPDNEETAIELLKMIAQTLSTKVLLRLYSQTDYCNLTPEELAVFLRTPYILQELYETERIKKFKLHYSAPFSTYALDVTDLDTPSFLGFSKQKTFAGDRVLVDLKEGDLADERMSRLLYDSPLGDYLKVKFDRWFYGVIIWFIARLLYSLSFMYIAANLMTSEVDLTLETPDSVLYKEIKNMNPQTIAMRLNDVMVKNKSVCHLNNAVSVMLRGSRAIELFVSTAGTIYANFFSACCILTDIFEIFALIISWLKKTKLANNYKLHTVSRTNVHHAGGRVVNNKFYRLTLFLQAGFVIYLSIGKRAWTTAILTSSQWSLLTYVLFYGVMCITNFWELLFFVQMIPSLSYFVVAFQRMISDLLMFSVIYLLVTISFAQVFYLFATIGCPALEAITFWDTWYDLFLTTLNIFEPLDGKHFQSIVLCSKILHVIVVFILATLMINFLIAVMSSTATIITENKKKIAILYQLDAAMKLEARLGSISAWLFPAFYYRRFQRTGKRIYLLVYSLDSAAQD